VLPVEIVPFNESVVLRARGSELLILPHHVRELKGKKTPQEFTNYFTGEALINRPARKLFEAWLRKDSTLWPRLYKTVHEQVKLDDAAEGAESSAKTVASKPVPKKAAAPAPAKPAAKSEDKVEKAAPKPEKKAAAKADPKKAEPKKPEAKAPAKSAAKAPDKTAAKKTAAKAAAKKPSKAKAEPAAKASKSSSAKSAPKKGKGK